MDILKQKLSQELYDMSIQFMQENSIEKEGLNGKIKTRISELVTDVDFSLPQTERNQNKCKARVWDSLLGGKQCSHNCKKGDYCDKHNRMLVIDKVLRFDDIRNPPPDYDLIKMKQGIYEPLTWLKSDPIQQLQDVLDLQSKKVVYSVPNLIL